MSDSEYEFDDIEAGLTSVLLGFTGKEASQSDLSPHGNHVGGSPVWLGDEAPSSALLKCKVCDKPLDLLAQLSCPLPFKDYDRVLYVLACSDPNCRRKEGSIKAIRGVESNESVRQRIAKEVEESQPENTLVPKQGSLGDSLFSGSTSTVGNSNPFGHSSIEVPAPQKPETQPQSSKSSKKKHKSKIDLRIVKGKYLCKTLEVEDEYLELPDTQKQLEGVKIEELDTETDTDKSGNSSKDTELPGAAAKEIEARSDPVFTHFIEVVENNPEQVLRYERGLKPLLYSGSDGVADKLKVLKNKILEVQLMPHLISELETDDMILDGMEWGTIFVATDSNDEIPELSAKGIGYCEEFVAVQWE